MTKAVLDDYRTAPIPEKLRLMLEFLEKLTLTPEDLDPKDTVALRAAGVSESAMREAIYTAVMFNLIDRLADTFQFNLLRPEEYAKQAQILLKRGYVL